MNWVDPRSVAGLGEVIGFLEERKAEGDAEAGKKLAELKSGWDSFWSSATSGGPFAGAGGDGGSPSGAPPVTAPVKPIEVLRDLAAGLAEAESVLNGEGLVIATGEVTVSLSVQAPGVTEPLAAAHTVITLKIGPRPYA